MKCVLLLVLLLVALIDAHRNHLSGQTLLNRLIRAANANKRECRYEKEAWEDCDPATGLQRRALKLKSSRSASTNCEPLKYIQRPCKKNCRYAKGVWSECSNGMKYRLDTLKGASNGCELTRNTTKTCKEPCHYTKSEWSSCENGLKTKTFTLITDGANTDSGCEATKVIKKQCGSANQRRQQKQRNRKNNSPPINS